MKAITTIVLISILNGFQPQPVVSNTTDILLDVIIQGLTKMVKGEKK